MDNSFCCTRFLSPRNIQAWISTKKSRRTSKTIGGTRAERDIHNVEAKYEDNFSEYSDRLQSPGSPLLRAQRPAEPPPPRNLKAKRIANRAQTKVAFRLPRNRDMSNP